MLEYVAGEAALLLKTRSDTNLILPDLHLGFEREFVKRGINIPSQTGKILEKVKHLVKSYHPRKLIFLGDIKHGTSRILPHEWVDIPRFFESLLELVEEIDVIQGNHDGGLRPLLPKGVSLHTTKGMAVKDGSDVVALTHGHAWPRPELLESDTFVIAHHHFTIELKDRLGLRIVEPIWVVTRWIREKIATRMLEAEGIGVKGRPTEQFYQHFSVKVKEPKIIVMPAFNPLIGGWPINSEAGQEYLGPFFKSGVVDLWSSELYLLDGTFLGKLGFVDKKW